MLWMRAPGKGKGAAPLVGLIKMLLRKDPDAALTWWLKQDEQMAEAMLRGQTLNLSTQPRGWLQLKRSI